MATAEALAKSIRIIWYQDGQKQRETLGLEPTRENMAHAEKLARLIQLELDTGRFDRLRHFPDSQSVNFKRFGQYIDEWLVKHEGSVAPSSWSSYTSHIENHIRPYFGKMIPDQITAAVVESWVTDVLKPKLANKTIREIMTRLRKVWEHWAVGQNDNRLMDPTSAITIRLPDQEEIDPFTRSEIDQILKHPTTPEMNNLWTCLIWSGLSMHELNALAIEDVDLKKNMINIRRSCVRGQYRVTKTRRRKRSVQMLAITAQAIASQISLVQTFPLHVIHVLDRDNSTIRQQKVRWLWLHEDHINHYNYDHIKNRWRQHLEACDVRYRAPNNGRHTYASQLLTTGLISAEWLAQQLGHGSTAMIHKHYGKFIPTDEPGHISRLNKHLSF